MAKGFSIGRLGVLGSTITSNRPNLGAIACPAGQVRNRFGVCVLPQPAGRTDFIPTRAATGRGRR